MFLCDTETYYFIVLGKYGLFDKSIQLLSRSVLNNRKRLKIPKGQEHTQDTHLTHKMHN